MDPEDKTTEQSGGKQTVNSLKADLEKVTAERDVLKAELKTMNAVPPDVAEKFVAFLKARIPVLFVYNGFASNPKQNMALHKVFVEEALDKLLAELTEVNNAG